MVVPSPVEFTEVEFELEFGSREHACMDVSIVAMTAIFKVVFGLKSQRLEGVYQVVSG